MQKSLKALATTIMVTLIAGLSIFAASAYNAKKIAEKPEVVETTPEVNLPEVSVVNVLPKDYRAEITGYGVAKSRFELPLKSEVSGQIVALADNFKTGLLIKKGEVLLNIDDQRYRKELASSQASLASANLALLEEQRKSNQAQLEWKNSGLSGKPTSLLVLREPHLQVAQAQFDQAKQELAIAQRDLNKTQLSVPFNALITERNVQLGSVVQAGEQVATLFSADRLEVSVPLSAVKWLSIDTASIHRGERIPAILISSDHTQTWNAYVDRVEQHRDETSRQRSIVIAIDKPLQQDPPLYPNSYVQASIQGKNLSNLLRLPQTSISQNNEVWYVDNGLLNKINPVKAYEDHNFVYIQPFTTQTKESLKIVVRPLNSYITGTKVSSVNIDEQTLSGNSVLKTLGDEA